MKKVSVYRNAMFELVARGLMTVGSNCFGLSSYYRVLVRVGATGAAAPVNLCYQVHAPVNFQNPYFFQTFMPDFPCS